MSCYLVQEVDGTSRFTLEDGSGFLLLEFCPFVPSTGGDGGRSEYARRRRRDLLDEDDWLATVLGEV